MKDPAQAGPFYAFGAIGTQVGIGTICGYATGRLMKGIGFPAAVAVGSGFALLQSLQYTGDVQVNWRKVERDYVKLLDLDEDGTVTSRDASMWLDRSLDVLKFNLPAGLGFTGGWVVGLGGPSSVAGKLGVAGVVYGLGSRLVLPRIAAAFGGATFAPALVVGVRDFWGRTKSALKATLSPAEQFRQAILDYDYGQLQQMHHRLEQERRKLGVSSRDLRILEMKQRVVADRLETVPKPSKSWWRFW